MSNGKPATGSARPNDKSAVAAEIEKINRHIKELRGFEVGGMKDRWDPRVEAMQKNINLTLAGALGSSSPEYRQYQLPAFDAGLDQTFNDRFTIEEIRGAVREGMDRAIGKLISVRDLLTQPPPKTTPAPASTPVPTPKATPAPAATAAPKAAPSPSPTPAPIRSPAPALAAAGPSPQPEPTPMSTSSPEISARGVAIVGQRGEPACDSATRFITQLGVGPVKYLEPDAVSDEPLVARLESLRSVGFAILVPSADPTAQALEIGFLLGALGRERVLLLTSGKGETVPALEGVASHAMDEGGIWPLLVARQMKQAGLDVDLNRAV